MYVQRMYNYQDKYTQGKKTLPSVEAHFYDLVLLRRDTKPRTTSVSDDFRVAAYQMSLFTLIPRQAQVNKV